MHKTTKIVLIICAAAILLTIGWFVLNRYGYNHPSLTVSFITSGEGDRTMTMPHIEIEERSSMGVSESWHDRYFEAYEIVDQMIAYANSCRTDEPYSFDSKVEIVDGKTVFTLSGEYTENGEVKQVSETYSLDYVLTEDIEEH